MSLFCIKTFGISVNIIKFLLDSTKKVPFDAVLCDKVETPVIVPSRYVLSNRHFYQKRYKYLHYYRRQKYLL